MFVELCKFIKSTSDRWTLWYINYTSIKMFKKNLYKLQSLRDQEDCKAVHGHGNFGEQSFVSVQNHKKFSSKLREDCSSPSPPLFGQKSSGKPDITMHSRAQGLRISAGPQPSPSLHVPQARGLELWYFLQHFLPLFSNFLSFGFVTCLKFPMFLTSIPVNYYCSTLTLDRHVSSCPAQ